MPIKSDGILGKSAVGVISALATTFVIWIVGQLNGWVHANFPIFVPETAVIVFDGRCPPGWDPFDMLAGRVVVGAGNGKDLTSRVAGQEGGTESQDFRFRSIDLNGNIGGSGQDRLVDSVNHKALNNGEFLPLENLPPFRVMQYCIKTKA